MYRRRETRDQEKRWEKWKEWRRHHDRRPTADPTKYQTESKGNRLLSKAALPPAKDKNEYKIGKKKKSETIHRRDLVGTFFVICTAMPTTTFQIVSDKFPVKLRTVASEEKRLDCGRCSKEICAKGARGRRVSFCQFVLRLVSSRVVSGIFSNERKLLPTSLSLLP